VTSAVEPSRWVVITQQDPDHSQRYADRFRTMAAEGRDLDGEARLIDAMVPRGSKILDAGCGPGRVGGALSELGHDVVGVDVDPVLIEAALEDHSGPIWAVGDLADLDVATLLTTTAYDNGFEAIVCAGNVMTFLAASTRRQVLNRLRSHLSGDGRLVVGFQSGRDYEFDDFFDDVASAGLEVLLRLATWDLRTFETDSDFLVAVLAAAKSD